MIKKIDLKVGSIRKISRGQFLNRGIRFGRTLGTVVTILYIVPSSAIGKDGSVPSSGRITMGVIGLGGQGTRDMRNFLTCADVRFTASCDVDTYRCNKVKAMCFDCRRH